MKKLLFSVLIMALMIAAGSIAYADTGEYIGDMEVVNCERYVSMREAPDTESDRILKISLGSVVEDCIVYDDKFIYGEFDMQYGYILSEYLEPCYGIKTFDYMEVVNCRDHVSLFSQPDTDSNRIVDVELGELVENCIIHDEEFTYAEYDGRCGFILSEYLQPISSHEAIIGWEYYGDLRVANCDEWVSLYAGPDIDSERKARVPLGATVENCYINYDEFIYGTYEGEEGYILSKYLIDKEYYAYDEIGYMQVSNCESWVSLREQATPASDRLARVAKDTIVEVMGEESDYYHVICDGVVGYIYFDYLEWIEGPYGDADDQLMNSRILLNYEGAAFGVFLISDSMGGDWSILAERNHLEPVFYSMPENWWPVVMTIPQERIIEVIGGYELYLIIPADDMASVSVSRMELGYDGPTGSVQEILYHSDFGDPILLRCNEFQAISDCQLIITDSMGNEVIWYPAKEMYEGRVYTGAEGGYCLDFTVYEEESMNDF